MNNIVIHNNNIDLFLFENDIPFDSTDNIDKYISEKIIPELLGNDFDRIFIKDNLSLNYLELVGLRVAYHIRLSQELGEKRFSVRHRKMISKAGKISVGGSKNSEKTHSNSKNGHSQKNRGHFETFGFTRYLRFSLKIP